MKLIKNAIVFKAELPDAERIAEHLGEMIFSEMDPNDYCKAGFVTLSATSELVSAFEGGYAFALRYDEKIVPSKSVTAEANKRIATIESEQECRLAKIDRQAIREQTFADLCRNALVNTSIVTAYYHTDDQLLIVATGSKKQAQTLMSSLVKVVGSVKTTTIHINELKGGLTTRMQRHINLEDNAFEPFDVGGECQLQGEKGRMSIKMDSLINSATQSVSEAITGGASVTSVRLTHGAVSFRLTLDFHLKSIAFDYVVDDATSADFDAKQAWQHEAALQTLHMVSAINEMCDLFGYQEPAVETAGEEAEAAA